MDIKQPKVIFNYFQRSLLVTIVLFSLFLLIPQDILLRFPKISQALVLLPIAVPFVKYSAKSANQKFKGLRKCMFVLFILKGAWDSVSLPILVPSKLVIFGGIILVLLIYSLLKNISERR